MMLAGRSIPICIQAETINSSPALPDSVVIQFNRNCRIVILTTPSRRQSTDFSDVTAQGGGRLTALQAMSVVKFGIRLEERKTGTPRLDQTVSDLVSWAVCINPSRPVVIIHTACFNIVIHCIFPTN